MKLFCSLLFSAIALFSYAQHTTVQQYINNLDSFYRYTPLEKAFLQTDKEWYFPGETIWFKAYATVDNELNELSKILYVDLSDKNGTIIEKTRWKLNQMKCKGDIYLSKELKPGNYILRVYTLYMLNYPEVIDEKIITVLSDSVTTKKIDTARFAPYLYLLPEGGNLVENLNSKVAYKITLPNQLPMQQISLQVTDNENNLIYSGTPLIDGMGYFNLKPLKEKTYKVKFTFNGITYTRNLPAADSTGLVMEVNNSNPNKIFLLLNTNNSTELNTVRVIAHMNGVAVYAQNYDLAGGNTGGAIDKKNLPNGILTITCFSENMQPLGERLVYINKYSLNEPVFEMQSLNIHSKAKNNFTLSNLPDSASLSISITDADKPETAFTNHNITSYFLLGSELKGYVHNPWSYFRKKDSSSIAAVDLVMLTNGWRRFKTMDIVKGKMPLINYYPETGIAITGNIKDQFRKKLNTGGVINAIIKTEDSTTIYADARFSDTDNGQFIISGLDFKKKARVYLKETTEHKGLSTAIEIHPVFIDTLSIINQLKITLFKTAQDSVRSSAPEKMALKFDYKKRSPNELTEIIVTGKVKSKEQQLTEEYSTEQFRDSEYTYAVDSTIAYASIWQFLEANVPGIIVSSPIDPTVNFRRYTGLRDASTGADQTFAEDMNSGKSSISFYLNEVMVPMESISDLLPKDVAMIKVNRNPNIGLNAPNGSIFVYTRKGVGRTNAGFNKIMITGYNTSKEFFNPVYESNESKATADYRTTLYWNPELKIINQQAVISFYNNDVTKRFRVVVSGYDKDGFPIYFERVIE